MKQRRERMRVIKTGGNLHGAVYTILSYIPFAADGASLRRLMEI